jgi:ferrochelatase
MSALVRPLREDAGARAPQPPAPSDPRALGPLPADHPPVRRRGVGLLVINLGTPDAPRPWAVKEYLAEFLSDRRVVELPRAIWWPLLHGVVLNTRPRKSAKAYAAVWDHARGDSPLRAITGDIAAALAADFPDIRVEMAMRYGRPAILPAILKLREAGCERILVAPLYPQYCGATTASAIDAVCRALQEFRWQPAIRTLPPWYDDPAYIAALRDSLDAGLAALDFEPQTVLASFHGMPQRTLDRGDPYHCQCVKTVRLLREMLGWGEDRLRLTFQSRFGAGAWLKPYTDETLAALPGQGVRRVAIIAPGFAADCLETLEELAIRGREQFLEAGGEHFAYIPCLNDSPQGIGLLRGLVARELAGWVELQQATASAGG